MMFVWHVIKHEMVGVFNVRCMRDGTCKSVVFVNEVVFLLEPVYHGTAKEIARCLP